MPRTFLAENRKNLKSLLVRLLLYYFLSIDTLANLRLAAFAKDLGQAKVISPGKEKQTKITTYDTALDAWKLPKNPNN